MFVGQTGVRRVIKRTCELMKEHNVDDVRPFGGIPLDLIQKYVNFWYSSSVDLFGSEQSSNAASYFASGIKGRAYEAKKYKDHKALEGSYIVETLKGDRISQEEVALRVAMNEVLRDDYIKDNESGVEKWNQEFKEQGINYHIKLPHRRFNRTVGMWSEVRCDPEGNLVTEAEWMHNKHKWLPTDEDKAFVRSLMQQVITPGKVAGWIAPPPRGINDQPFDFEYVKL